MPRTTPTDFSTVALSKLTKTDLQNFQRTLSYRHETYYTVDDIINILLDYYIAMELTNN